MQVFVIKAIDPSDPSCEGHKIAAVTATKELAEQMIAAEVAKQDDPEDEMEMQFDIFEMTLDSDSWFNGG